VELGKEDHLGGELRAVTPSLGRRYKKDKNTCGALVPDHPLSAESRRQRAVTPSLGRRYKMTRNPYGKVEMRFIASERFHLFSGAKAPIMRELV
jgi:hypothetical protein